jgi:hypothetical protein
MQGKNHKTSKKALDLKVIFEQGSSWEMQHVPLCSYELRTVSYKPEKLCIFENRLCWENHTQQARQSVEVMNTKLPSWCIFLNWKKKNAAEDSHLIIDKKTDLR